MIICAKCLGELKCTKNGVILKWGTGHCYSSDRFECKHCDITVLNAPGSSFFADEFSEELEVVEME